MVLCSQKPVDAMQVVSFGKRFLTQPIPHENKLTGFRVHLGSMNWTSNFVVQSDKLEIVSHLLLAPVDAVVKPAEHEFAHRLDPSPGTLSRCLQQNCRSTQCSVGGRTGA